LKRKAQKQHAPGDSIRFARNLFWVSWFWVLLFVVGDLFEAETRRYGAKIMFGIVTLLAIGTGGYALEKTLISARPGKTHRSGTAQPSTRNRRARTTGPAVERSSEPALLMDTPAKVDDNDTAAEAAAQNQKTHRKRRKART
jgi:hypothetical protein